MTPKTIPLNTRPMPPILHGHTSPSAARWLRPRRLRALWQQPFPLKASRENPLPLWVRARGPAGEAAWIAMHPGSGADPAAVVRGDFTPDRTGLWTLELAVETAPGRVALVPGEAVHALVEHPHFASMRAYTLIPRVCGELNAWRARLPEIRRMGFNAIWLLPISRMGASLSPYSSSDPMAVDPVFAPDSAGWDEAKAFADACKEEELGLGVDLVLNHVAPDGHFAKKHPQWLAWNTEEEDGLDRSGWREGLGGPFHAWRDLVRLRLQEKDKIQSHADRVEMLEYWTHYAQGWVNLAARSALPMVRLDNAHSTPPILLDTLLPVLRRDHPTLSVLGEFFDDQPGAAEAFVWRCGIERLLATPWMEPFAAQKRRLLGFLDDVDKHSAIRHFVPLCSHDSPSAAQAYGGAQSIGPRYAALSLLSGGCSGVVQGTEWSTPHKVEFIGAPGTYPKGESQHEVLRAINGILEREGPLMGTPTHWLDSNHGAVIGGLRIGIHGPLLVAANLDTTGAHTLPLGEVAHRRWVAAYAQGCERVGDDLVLAPGGVGIFKAAELPLESR